VTYLNIADASLINRVEEVLGARFNDDRMVGHVDIELTQEPEGVRVCSALASSGLSPIGTDWRLQVIAALTKGGIEHVHWHWFPYSRATIEAVAPTCSGFFVVASDKGQRTYHVDVATNIRARLLEILSNELSEKADADLEFFYELREGVALGADGALIKAVMSDRSF
jgi:hypothetical protein